MSGAAARTGDFNKSRCIKYIEMELKVFHKTMKQTYWQYRNAD